MMSNGFSMTILSLTIALCGCGGPSTSDEMAERWYRYGQHVGSMFGKQTPEGEEWGVFVGFYLLGDTSPEATLLMSSGVLSSEEALTLFKNRLDEGVLNPKDTSDELFLDPLPQNEREESNEFIKLYARTNFAAPEAQKVILANLQSKSFPVRALYARHLRNRSVAGHESKSGVLSELERQMSQQPEREKIFWSLLRAMVESHKPTPKPKLTDRELCRAHLETLSNAEMAYRVTNKTDFTTDLSKLVKVMEKDLPVCPGGGTYSVILAPRPSFTVHCSVKAHDEGIAGEPAGYSPGLNSG